MDGFSFDGKVLKVPVFEPSYPVNYAERIKKGVRLIGLNDAKATNAYVLGLSTEEHAVVNMLSLMPDSVASEILARRSFTSLSISIPISGRR